MRVLVVRHHAEDDPGFIGAAFAARGAALTSHLFPKAGPLPAPDSFDHAIVLGATASVNDSGPESSWISSELAWLRAADTAGVPVLGVCFGAQALSVAHGGSVTLASRPEVGWSRIDSVDEELIPAGPWLQFHHDQCLPPPTAQLLARSEVCVQAFSIGRHLAVHFHPEVDGAQLKAWLNAGAREEAAQAGQDPDRLLADTIAREPGARGRAAQIVATAIRLATARPAATIIGPRPAPQDSRLVRPRSTRIPAS